MLPMTSPLTYPLKGSRRIVLQCLQHHAVQNCCVLSYEQIAELTGYCPETVRQTIRILSQEFLIAVEKHLGERRNIYRVLHRVEAK